MSYTFDGSLFNTRTDAARACVEEFLWAGGMNSPQDVAQALQERDQTIQELMENWDLNISQDPENRDELTRDEVAAVIDEMIADPAFLDSDE